MSRLSTALAAALLASSALAQSTPNPELYSGPIHYGGRFDLATGQLIPSIAGAVQAAPDVIYRNTCLTQPNVGYYPIGTATAFGATARFFDTGRAPSKTSTPAGAVNTYRVTQLSLAYVTNVPDVSIGGVGAAITIQLYADYDADTDPATQGPPVFNGIATGLPGTLTAGQPRLVLIDLAVPAAIQFNLAADADGSFQNVANSDTFGVAFGVPATQPAGLFTGPVLAGVPTTCVEGNGTYYLNPGATNEGTGLGNAGGVTLVNGAVITPIAAAVVNGQPQLGLWFEITGDFNDCNNNDISDLADIVAGTSLDTDANGEPDECAPVVILNPYCTGATTTQGCTPLIGGSGTASASANSGFTITVTLADAQRQGLVFYGADNSGFSPLPWAAGSTSFLCVKSPTQRLPGQNTGGTLTQCNGQLQYDWNAFRAANPTAVGSPFTAGDVFYAQGWMRDPAAPKSTNLSNGLEFNLAP